MSASSITPAARQVYGPRSARPVDAAAAHVASVMRTRSARLGVVTVYRGTADAIAEKETR